MSRLEAAHQPADEGLRLEVKHTGRANPECPRRTPRKAAERVFTAPAESGLQSGDFPVLRFSPGPPRPPLGTSGAVVARATLTQPLLEEEPWSLRQEGGPRGWGCIPPPTPRLALAPTAREAPDRRGRKGLESKEPARLASGREAACPALPCSPILRQALGLRTLAWAWWEDRVGVEPLRIYPPTTFFPTICFLKRDPPPTPPASQAEPTPAWLTTDIHWSYSFWGLSFLCPAWASPSALTVPRGDPTKH